MLSGNVPIEPMPLLKPSFTEGALLVVVDVVNAGHLLHRKPKFAAWAMFYHAGKSPNRSFRLTVVAARSRSGCSIGGNSMLSSAAVAIIVVLLSRAK